MLPVFYAGQVRMHRTISSILGCIVVVLLAASSRHGNTRQCLVYLVAVAISVVAIDAMSSARQASSAPIPVRDPRLESLVLVGCGLIALAWLTSRFVFNFRPESAGLRLAWIVIGLGSVFSILPALFLFSRHCGSADLGLRFRGITTVLPVLAIFVGTTFAFSRHTITWSGALAEAGSPLGLVQMAIVACLPEEFFRFTWQTRIGAWMKNPAVGWLIASIAWAMLHGPVDYSQSHSTVEAMLSVIDIVPLGLLWGYLTHRTGSFLPSMLLHGLNFWGLQNL
jgi:membrane protease YdiL (CAAX protease family)